jgi:4-amino-4-deoxy-L-arabinose transferase-like glycosyltransferase
MTDLDLERKSPASSSLGLGATVWCVAVIKLAVHLYAGRHYGYFVDELYYLACGDHLDWGFVDQPPLIALVAKLIALTLGTSLAALRLLPALAGAAEVLVTAAIARELGGGRFAQGFAALTALTAPGFLLIDSFLSMNCFEPLFWMGCAYLLIRIIKTGNYKLWLWFGVLAGAGLENKHSMLIFGFGLVAGLLLTRERRLLFTPWVLAAGLLAFLIFLPNLLWNVQHHFPFLEIQANIRRSGRDVTLTPASFFAQEVLAMLPVSLPVWLAGVWFYFFTERGRRFRALGWVWLATAAIIVFTSPRIYYLFPAFPLLLAAGSVEFENWLAPPRWTWARIAYPALVAALGVLLAPLAIPLLPAETYIRYAKAMHLEQPRIETHSLGPLPQIFADQFGWEEMAATVAGVYNRLPPDVRAKTAIFGQNYGEAGAIDLFGPKYGLPKAISAHQNYFLWGPRDYTGESIIVMDDRQQRLETRFAHVEKVATVYHPYSMPYRHFDVFYCTGLKQPLKELWPKMKNWD